MSLIDLRFKFKWFGKFYQFFFSTKFLNFFQQTDFIWKIKIHSNLIIILWKITKKKSLQENLKSKWWAFSCLRKIWKFFSNWKFILFEFFFMYLCFYAFKQNKNFLIIFFYLFVKRNNHSVWEGVGLIGIAFGHFLGEAIGPLGWYFL